MRQITGLWFLILSMALAGEAYADCEAIARKAKGADLTTLETLYQEARQTSDCNPAFRDWLGLKVARIYLRQVNAELDRNPEADVFGTLQKSLEYGQLWQTLAMLGDIYYDQRDFYQAAVHYQEALVVIADPDKTEESPAPKYIGKIFKKAERSRLLADAFVPTPRDRDGEPSGLAATDIRGFAIKRVPIPITFYYDSTDFDTKGEAYAADLLEYLSAQGSPAITLIGHTDPRGTDAYNLKLSQRRAEALKKWLIERGYRGSTRTEGRGEREPLELDDALVYSQEEIYRLNRRVELQR